MEIQQKRLAHHKALDESLNEILETLRKMPEVKKVILFGSYAAGRRDLFTDIDLIVIMDTGEDLLHRTAGLVQRLQAKVDLDLLVYSPEEFERLRESGFIRHAVETGQVVYEKKRAG